MSLLYSEISHMSIRIHLASTEVDHVLLPHTSYKLNSRTIDLYSLVDHGDSTTTIGGLPLRYSELVYFGALEFPCWDSLLEKDIEFTIRPVF